MIKSELINSISAKIPNLPEKDIATSINLILEYMSENLANQGRIEIRNFGSFSLHFHPERNAHNPKTGVKVKTNAKYRPHFKPGKELRERIDASRLTTPIHEDPDLLTEDEED